MTLSNRELANLILRIRRHQITGREYDDLIATIHDPEQELKIDDEWRNAAKGSAGLVTRRTLAIAFANGDLDKDLIKMAVTNKAWGDERENARDYGDKLRLVAYDEASGTDNRGRINLTVENICNELGLRELSYTLRGNSSLREDGSRDKKFWLIEYLRIQELAKEVVNRGRLDLLDRLTNEWTRGDYNLAADFLETDKVFKGPAKGVLESGSEFKDENMGKIMFDHRDTWRPLVTTLMSFSKSFETLRDAQRKASQGALDIEGLEKLVAEKPLIEESWTKVTLDGTEVRDFESGDSSSYLVWDNQTFWDVAETPDLEYYVTRLAIDRSAETREGVWVKARQLDLAQAVGKSQKFLDELASQFKVRAGELDVLRHRTILGKIWMPPLSMGGITKQARGIERGIAKTLATQTGPLKNDPRISAFVIWLGVVMLVAWPFIMFGRDTTPNDTVRNVLILFPITLIATKFLANWLGNLSVGNNRWMFWGVLGGIVLGIAISFNASMTADNDKKEQNYTEWKRNYEAKNPGVLPSGTPARVDFGR